jgi:hypothetical protein
VRISSLAALACLGGCSYLLTAPVAPVADPPVAVACKRGSVAPLVDAVVAFLAVNAGLTMLGDAHVRANGLIPLAAGTGLGFSAFAGFGRNADCAVARGAYRAALLDRVAADPARSPLPRCARDADCIAPERCASNLCVLPPPPAAPPSSSPAPASSSPAPAPEAP